MASDPPPTEPSRAAGLLDALLARDGAGGSWLSPLLCAAPRGREHFGELAQAPGWLEAPIAVRTETGRRGAFEHPAAPTRRMLGWYIDHPGQLTFAAAESTPEATRLRRALLDDDPPGVRERAQERAHGLLSRGMGFAPAWWRLEEAHTPDCLLITDRLLLLVRDVRDAGPATPWFPARSALVRDLEAAQRFAEGKAWGVLALGEAPLPAAADTAGHAAELLAGAPHLDADERDELGEGYLGELSLADVAAATGPDPATLSAADA